MRKDDDVRKKGKIYFDEKLEEKLLSRKIMISHKIQLWNFYAHTWRMCMIFSVVYIKDSPYFSASSYTFKILLLLLSILLYVLLAFLSVFPLTHSAHRHECERVQIDQNQDEWILYFLFSFLCLMILSNNKKLLQCWERFVWHFMSALSCKFSFFSNFFFRLLHWKEIVLLC